MRGLRLADRYILAAPLGRGAMGEVWRGEDEVLGREVAVKLLRLESGADAELAVRFRREARAAARLSSPHIVSVFDLGKQDDLLFLVMELLQGRTLRQVLNEEGPLPIDRVLGLGSQTCLALDAAHRAGVIHRDIKPGNLMVIDDGTLKVLDFGIARFVQGLSSGEQDLTRVGTVVGTSAYISPEQILGRPVDARTDLYGLGCVLYTLLTGHPPFHSDTAHVLMYQHVYAEPTPPRRRRPDIPAALDELILRMLAKSPDDRPADARTVREGLKSVIAAPQAPTGRPSERAGQASPATTGPIFPVTQPISRVVSGAAGDSDSLHARRQQADNLGKDGNLGQAIRVYRDLVSDYEHVLGPDHPETLTTRNNLACWIGLNGAPAEGLRLLRELLPHRERALGADHPDSLVTRRNIAYFAGENGDPAEALRLYRALLPDYERVLGRDHPDTIEARTQITYWNSQAGRHRTTQP